MRMSGRNILYLTYDGLTDPLGQSQILPYITRLSALGYSFTIVSFEKNTMDKVSQEKVRAACLNHTIEWVPLGYHKHPPIISTVYDLYQLRSTVKELFRKRDFEIVHCRSYITSLLGLWLKRKRGTKFIFDMRGFWADERVDGGLWNLKNPVFRLVYNFFKRKEQQFLRESNYVVVLTENANRQLLSWGIKTPAVVIPCCVDAELFDPEKISEEQQQQIRNELEIHKADFVLLYLGSWGTWYMTNEMLDFFSTLKTKYTTAKFLIISPDTIELGNYIYRDDVRIKKVLRENIPLYLSLASASIFFIKPTFSKKASSATKMGELLAMNVPVITNRGWGDVEAISKESTLYFQDSIILQNFEVGAAPPTRDYCLANLTLESGTDRYDSVYKKVLQNEINS